MVAGSLFWDCRLDTRYRIWELLAEMAAGTALTASVFSKEYEWVVSYLWALFWNWWTLALAILGVNEVLEWQRAKSLRWLHVHRVKIAVVFVILAQALAYRDLKRTSVQTDAPRQKFDVADVDARKELAETKKKLDEAYKTIHELDPLQQPISAVSADAQVLVELDQTLNVHAFNSGAKITLERGSEALLFLSVGDSYQKTTSPGTVAFVAAFNLPPYGPLLGRPIKELSTAEDIQLEFQGTDMPQNASIIGGRVVLIINGNQRFEFNIKEQTADGRKIFLRDLTPLSERFNH
jgi:hypothetical protein